MFQSDTPPTSFQTFETQGGPEYGRRALPLLRAKLSELSLDGLFVPHEDEWQNEYVPPSHDRLRYVTGFTGSAGAAIIMQDSAHMFVDGRYTIQVRVQTDESLFQYHSLVDNPPNDWVKTHVKAGVKIGYDPRLITPDGLKALQQGAAQSGAILIELAQNPIDQIWHDRPPTPVAIICPHEDSFSGENSASKRAKIAENLSGLGQTCVILTSPPSLAWVFNIRGGDVQRSPLPLGAAIINNDGTSSLFVNPAKVTPELRGHLGNGVQIFDESEFEITLARMNEATVALDPKLTSAQVFNILTKANAKIIEVVDPTALARAAKNSVEIKGAINAHIRDGVAMAKFLKWFDDNAPSGNLTEIDAAKALEGFRALSPELKDLSFDSISGAGSNGAICHYRVSEESNLIIAPNSLFLIDSGGQYKDGTTDITRTIGVGETTPEMKDRFTRVLKGHIALSRIKFPVGTPGSMLDTLARMFLWEAGLDYDHGTGHGVGSYLGVHEGPHRISKVQNNVAMQTGMIVSNEPGFYKDGEFGIRIENLQYVTEPQNIEGGERPMLGFGTLTLAPIDTRQILLALMTAPEIEWINNYHAKVAQTIGPYLHGAEREWLVAACRAI